MAHRFPLEKMGAIWRTTTWGGRAIVTQFAAEGDTKITLNRCKRSLHAPAAGYRAFPNALAGENRMSFRISPSRFVLLLVVFALALLGAHGKTLLLDDSDDNSHVCLYIGDTLTIKLASNPSTGYSWGNPQVSHVQMISSDSKEGSSGRVGEPGFQTFSFKATDEGESTFTLRYFRRFEKGVAPVKTFLLFVTIEPRPFVNKDYSGKP
jgi:inhibitor of cysteine peptidase